MPKSRILRWSLISLRMDYSVHGKNMSWSCNSLIHWKARQIRYVPASPVPLIFPRLFRANGCASVPVLVVLKATLRVSGRVFKLSCPHIFLRLHIVVIPRSNLVANEHYAFIGNRGGVYPCCHSRGFILHLDLLSRQNTQRTGSALLHLIYYLPWFLIDSWPMRCSCSPLYRSFLVIFWCESSSDSDGKGKCRRSR